MGNELLAVLLSVASIGLYKFIRKPRPPAINNIYNQPDKYYPLKFAFVCVLLTTRKYVRLIKNQIKKIRNIDVEQHNKLERPQKLSNHELAIDAVYFNGSAPDGSYIVLGTARRQNGLVDGFIYLKIAESNLGLIETIKLPSSSLYQETFEERFAAEGIEVTPVEPMKKWKITFNGKMKSHYDFSKIYDVHLEAEFIGVMPYFNFDTDMSCFPMARAMAREVWSRDYFKILQKMHQTHYEQHGNFNIKVKIDDVPYEVSLLTMRDHSFGEQRDWRSFHRYILMFFGMENGDRVTVGVISTPIMFSTFKMGFIYKAKENKTYPLENCDLELYQIGEDGVPPKKYDFTFVAGGTNYAVHVNVNEAPAFFISKDWESRIIECMGEFNMNGENGWGSAEWEYRNIDGKSVPEHLKT